MTPYDDMDDYVIWNNYAINKNNLTNIWKDSIKNIMKNSENINNSCHLTSKKSELLLCLHDIVEKSKAHHHYQEKLINHLKITLDSLKMKLSNQQAKHARQLSQYAPPVSSDNQCCICMSEQKNYAYIGCGHMCVCRTCAETWGNKCPICKTNSSVIRIYTS